MNEAVFEPLSRRHDRDAFDCGVDELNVFLRQHARQNQSENFSRTYVAILPPSVEVVGFITIAVASVEPAVFRPEQAKRLPRYSVSVVHLGRLAVAVKAQKRGLGELLLMHGLEQSYRISQIGGVHGVEVRAKDAESRAFYIRYGFTALAGC